MTAGDAELQLLYDRAKPDPVPPRAVPSNGRHAPTPVGLVRTAREIAEASTEGPTWIAPPWVAAGAVTELSGPVKRAGKSTWALALTAAVLAGDAFLGEPTERTGVVMMSEMADGPLREALRRVGLLAADDLSILSLHRGRGIAWADAVAVAVETARSSEARLLIVDTTPAWCRLAGESENDSGAALAALAPLQAAAAEHGLAVISIRHDRKGGGPVGESGRGSSAWAGGVDTLLQLARPDGNVARPTIRVLRGESRFDGVHPELVIELRDDGRYQALGDAADIAAQEARRSIIDAVSVLETASMSSAELIDRAELKRSTGVAAIKQLYEAGTLARTGTGHKGSPYRYWRPDGVP